VGVPQVPKRLLLHGEATPQLAEADAIRQVAEARNQQHQRQGRLNADLSPRDLARNPRLDSASLALLSTASDRFALSARAYHRVLKVARTVADLERSPEIMPAHIGESLSYRAMDWDQL
jgi:magnesium chelatase family protein